MAADHIDNPTPEPAPPALHQSSHVRIPVPSCEDTDDRLQHGKALTCTIEQARQADIRRRDITSSATALTIGVDINSPDDPTWKAALASPDRKAWIHGAEDELCSL